MVEKYVIDGNRFETLSGFYDEVSDVVIPGVSWGRNLDAFNDILRGGFGTPDEGFQIIWKNSSVSKAKLGHEETVKVLQKRLINCHGSGAPHVREELRNAQQGKGTTVFDTLVEIILDHGEDGEQAIDNVQLILD